jgi:Virulence factor BrkB
LSSVFDHLGAYLPGLVRDAQHPEGLIPAQPPQAVPLTITGVIAFVALVLAGLGWLRATREGIRAVFGARGSEGSLVINTVRDLGVLFTLGLGIALLAVLTSVVGWAAQGIGMSGEGWIVILAGFVVSVLADTALMIVLLRVVSGVPVPWRDLLQGALVGGVGLSLLKTSAAALLPRLSANPLFASFAIVVGLLIWLNLVARLVLISAAWTANDLDETHGGGFHAQMHVLSRVPDTAGRRRSVRLWAWLGRPPSAPARCRPWVRGPVTVQLWGLGSFLVPLQWRPRELWPAAYGPWFVSAGVDSQLTGRLLEMLRHAQLATRASALIPPATPTQPASQRRLASRFGAEVVGGGSGRPAGATVGLDAAGSPGSTSSPTGVSEGPWAKAQPSIAAAGCHVPTGLAISLRR